MVCEIFLRSLIFANFSYFGEMELIGDIIEDLF